MATYNPRYRTLPVGQIMAQREGNPNARYADGRAVPEGMPIYNAGYNTSGVGPGTRGYRGQGGIQGYSYENQGTAQSKGRSNYSPYFGGLNEFYQNQQTAGQWDQLQGRAAMDRSDAIGSRMGQMSQFAAGRGDYETADVFAAALADRAAQRMAAQSGGSGGIGQAGPQDAWSDRTTFGDGGGPLIPIPTNRPLHSWEEQGLKRAEIFGDQFGPQLDPTSPEVQAMLDQAALKDRNRTAMVSPQGENFRPGIGRHAFQTPFGKASNLPLVGSGSTFNNAQGSMGPGGTRTAYGGVQSGADFFQQSADRQRTGNAFAQPGPGYNGAFDTSQNIGEYGRLMAVRNKLRK